MRRHLRSARTVLLVMTAICAIALTIPLVLHANARLAMMAPTATELALVLHRVGLDPESMAAASMTPGDVEIVVDNCLGFFTERQGDIALNDMVCAALKRTHDQLVRRVRSGRATEAEILELSQVRDELAAARAQREMLMSDMFAASTADLAPARVNLLADIRRHRHWKLPLEFLVIDQEEPDRVVLRNALANERYVADHEGEAMDGSSATLLDQLRDIPAVSTARASLDANLSVITSAWESAVGI